MHKLRPMTTHPRAYGYWYYYYATPLTGRGWSRMRD